MLRRDESRRLSFGFLAFLLQLILVPHSHVQLELVLVCIDVDQVYSLRFATGPPEAFPGESVTKLFGMSAQCEVRNAPSALRAPRCPNTVQSAGAATS